MEQQQPQKEQHISLSKCIEDIDSLFGNISSNTEDEFPQIPNKSKVLLFFGEFEKQFDSFYDHFEIKQVLQNKKHYKLVRIEKEKKESYLLHFPLILTYDDQNDGIAQNLCISKILAEIALKKMESYIQQLKGDDDKTKLDNVFKDSIFYFGSYYFTEDQFYMLRYFQEKRWNYSYKSNGFFSVFQKSEELKTQTLNQNEILKEIFKSNNDQKLMIVKSVDQINYGRMMTYLDKQQTYLKEQCNQNILQFQKLLLYLQQMSRLKNNEIIKEVEAYLKKLEKGLNDEQKHLTGNASEIMQVFSIINKVNQGFFYLGRELSIEFKREIIEFLKDNNIEQLKIEPLISDELVGKLKGIILFFEKYHNNLFKNEKIIEVQHLKLNLKQWYSYYNEGIKNTMYELKYITDRIQQGPQNEIENAIYFIGATKAGKSTIINSLLYPDKIEVAKNYKYRKSYGIEMETKFKIGQGAVSETQKISGVYIGRKEELNQIFNQEDQSVFSLEEVLDQSQIKECKIPQKWFIFDCPGFDDNSNELIRSYHRISLYNYFSKTKNLIVFFVIDISKEDIRPIKNTFDPIIKLLENKKALVQYYGKWTNLILTKTIKEQRQTQQENWVHIFENKLDQDYSFYKELFNDNGRCIEFLNPTELVSINDYIKSLNDSIIKMAQKQLINNQFKPKFTALDYEIWRLYEQCIPKAKLKLENIIKLLLEDLDQYILESDDVVEVKKEQILRLQNIFFTQNKQQMINEITQENYKEILQGLQNWIKDNKYLQDYDILLKQYIQDMESIQKIQNYCKNTFKIVQFIINIDNLVNKIRIILGTDLLGSGGVISIKAFGLIDGWKNEYLKEIYQKKLNEQKMQLEKQQKQNEKVDNKRQD